MSKMINRVTIAYSMSFLFTMKGKSVYELLPKHFNLSGYSPAQIGFVMSFTGLGAMLILPFLLFVVDRFKNKSILSITLILHIVIPLLYFVPFYYPTLYAIPRFFQGGFFAVLLISYWAGLSYVLPHDQRYHGFALFGSMGQIGMLISVGIGEFIYDAHGFFWIYIFGSGLFAFSLLLLQSFPESKYAPDTTKPKLQDILIVLKQRQIYPLFFWIFILGYGFGSMTVFIPKVVLSAGLSQIKPFYIAFPLTVLFLRFTSSHLFDRVPKDLIVAIPMIVLPASMITVSYIRSNFLLVISGILYGFSHGILFPVLYAYLLEYSPLSFRGRMSLFFHFMYNLGIFFASNAGGLIAEISIRLTFRIGAAFLTLGFLVLILRKIFPLLKASRR